MALDLPMATLADLKTRLGWSTADEDAVLTEHLKSVSAAIEAEVGRPLRRVHGRTEVFNGGNRVLRAAVAPIAKIHSIRESEDRDFDTAANYDELVEGDDYILDSDVHGVAGGSGIIRRIDQDWLGSNRSPGMIQVVYSGGFKTEGEEDLENAESTISSSESIENYTIVKNTSSGVLKGYEHSSGLLTVGGSTSLQQRAVIIFDIRDTILGTWKAFNAKVEFVSADVDGGDGIVYIVPPSVIDVHSASLSDFWDAMIDEDYNRGITNEAGTRQTFQLDEETNSISAVSESIIDGYLTFVVAGGVEPLDGTDITIASVEHATSALRPLLTVTHRLTFSDRHTMPKDLRHACLLQAAHEYQTRSQLGYLAGSQRGVSIAQGASYHKKEIDLLPAVLRTCAHYKELF